MTVKARIYENGDFHTAGELVEISSELVEGRNLLQKSGMNSLDGWSANGQSLVSMENGFLKNLFTGSVSTPGIKYLPKVTLPKGVYTLSVKADLTNFDKNKAWTLYFLNGIPSTAIFFPIPKPDGLGISTVTFELTTDIANKDLYILTSAATIGDYILYDWMKLEKGAKATPWSPAPEDLGYTLPSWVQNFDSPVQYHENGIAVKELNELPNSLLFDGLDDYIQVNKNYGLIAQQPFSFKIRFFSEGRGSKGDPHYGCLVGYNTSHRILISHSTGAILTQLPDSFTSTKSIKVNEWNELIYSFDGVKQSYILNGEPAGEMATIKPDWNSALFRVGAYDLANYMFKGKIAYVALYNKALSLADSATAVKEDDTSLLGYWKLDEGVGNSALDSSLSNNTGTIYGASWVHEYENPISIAPNQLTVKGAFTEGVTF